MSVRLKQRYSLYIIVLIVTLLSFFIISKDRIEITVISEFNNPDDRQEGGAGPTQDPGDNENLKIESCKGVEEPVSDVRYISTTYINRVTLTHTLKVLLCSSISKKQSIPNWDFQMRYYTSL